MSVKAIIQFLLVLVFTLLALYFESPIEVQPKDSDGFSAERVYSDLEKIADRIHFIGSDANKEKKEFIISRFSSMGYLPKVFTGESHIRWGSNHRQAKTENILVEKKGTEGKKKVVVLGHYDSVTNSPGAADDGHSIGCMLEVASLIRNSSFKNDILFLITDGEETGLHGARAYVDNYNLDSIGIVLNFEARGNSGPTYAFEWSDNNAWLVNAFKKNVSRPIASSLSYEIYNRMPNGSDFTEFKDRGIAGINNAFIDGFAYYHSPIDLPENINLNSVQHSGDNMYNLVKFFGDVDLTLSPEGNATFFNLYSSLVVYPSWLDLILLIITVLMVIFLIGRWMKKGEIKFSSLLLSLIINVLLLILAGIMGYGFQALIKLLYPHYFQFYAGQFYNHKLYLLALVGLIILLQSFGGRRLFRKVGVKAYSFSVMLIWLVMAISTFVIASTAAYLFMVPLMVLGMANMVVEFYTGIEKNNYKFILYFIPLLIVLGIWAPAVHSLFLAFSLSSLIAPAILLYLLMTFIMLVTPDIWGVNKLPYIIGSFVFLSAIICGDLTSSPTEKTPLPSNLNYYYNQNASTSFWITSDRRVNEANAGAIEEAESKEVEIPRKVNRLSFPANTDYHVPINIIRGEEEISLRSTFSFLNEGLICYVFFQDLDGVANVVFNGKELYNSTQDEMENLTVSLYGYRKDFLSFDIIKSKAIDKEIVISSYIEGLPRKDIIPDNYMRTGGHTITTLKTIR